jgi:hypothetical protein
MLAVAAQVSGAFSRLPGGVKGMIIEPWLFGD